MRFDRKEIDYKGNPFFLDDTDIQWVKETFDGMNLEEKCGQVFCPMGFSSDEDVLKGIVSGIGVGGMMYRSGRAKEIQETHRKIQSLAKFLFLSLLIPRAVVMALL